MCASAVIYERHCGRLELLESSLPLRGLREILNARRPVTEKTAMMFETALGVDAEPLIRLQVRYNMRVARKDKSFMQRLDNIRKVVAAL